MSFHAAMNIACLWVLNYMFGSEMRFQSYYLIVQSLHWRSFFSSKLLLDLNDVLLIHINLLEPQFTYCKFILVKSGATSFLNPI
jgi:hypothetical protein